MNEEASTGAPAMQTETETRTDQPTRRRGESPATVRPPDGDTIGSKVERAAREGLTAPEGLALGLLAVLGLLMLGTMFMFSLVYVMPILVLPALVLLLVWSIW